MQTYAIADPHAMMIHSHDASIALGAVMGSWRLDGVAKFAALPELFTDKPHLTHVKSSNFADFNIFLTL